MNPILWNSRCLGLMVLLIAISLDLEYHSAKDYIQGIPGTSASFEMIYIPSGNLVSTVTKKKLAELNGFWMSKYEITYDQYQPFRDKNWDSNKSDLTNKYHVDGITRPTVPYHDFTHGMGSTGGYPMVSMTQQAALRYCQWLYEKTGVFYRLPTDIEWEYACHGGKPNHQSDPDKVAWHWDNSNDEYHKVGQKTPNGYGLYDMLGNVSEYTVDQYMEGDYNIAQLSYPHMVASPVRGKYGRSVRGGAYDDEASDCTCTYSIPSIPAWQARDPQIPKSKWWNPDSPFVGFRIMRPEGEFTDDEVNAYFNRVIKE